MKGGRIVSTITTASSKTKTYFKSLSHEFGITFLVLLASAYYGVKGTLYTFVMSGQLPYYQKYVGVTGVQYQTYRLISSLPWSMKAWIGMVSDTIPIYGYHKKVYLVIVAFIGSISFMLMGIIKISEATAFVAALLLFVASFDIATTDLLCEGKYAEKMMEKPHTGGDLVTWVWGVYQMGVLTASCFIGPISDAYSPKLIYLICIPFALQFLIPLALGYFPEEKVTDGIKLDKVKERPKLFALAFMTAACALGLGGVHMFGGRGTKLMYTIFSSIFLCCASHWALPRMLSNCNIYMFLCEVLYIQVSGAIDYFYTASDECLPDGPHFDFKYYTTFSSIVGALAGWLGVILFQAIMRDWNFRKVFWFTTVIRVMGAIFDIVIAKRWNVLLGISDKAIFMLGDAIIYSIVYQMNFMPAVVLTSKVCPKGVESTVYALLAGFQNLGQNVSQSIGLYLIELLGLRTACKGGDDTCDCNFQRLPFLLFVCHIILPLTTIPLTFFLIPNKKMTESIQDGGEQDPIEYDKLVALQERD